MTERERVLGIEVDDLLSAISNAIHRASQTRYSGSGASNTPWESTGSAVSGTLAPFPSAAAAAVGLSLTNNSGTNDNGDASSATATLGNTMAGLLGRSQETLRRLDSEQRHSYQQIQRLQRDLELVEAERKTQKQRAADAYIHTIKLERQIALAEQKTTALVKQLDDKEVELLRLRRFVRMLPPTYAGGYAKLERKEEGAGSAGDLLTALGLVPDRRFQEAFEDKMGVITYRRRYDILKLRHQSAMEKLEALQMEMEENRQSHQQQEQEQSKRRHTPSFSNFYPSTAPIAVEPIFPVSLSLFDQLAVASTSAFMQPSASLSVPHFLHFSTTTPQDASVKSLISRSSYEEQLRTSREGLLRLCTQLKTTHDHSIRALYSVHQDAIRHVTVMDRERLHQSFERMVEKAQREHRGLLFSLVDQTNAFVKGVAEAEKQGGARQMRKLTRDVGCTAHDTTLEDYKCHRLQEQLTLANTKAATERYAAQEQLDAARRQCKEARHCSLEALGSVETLGKAIVAAARFLAKTREGGKTAAVAVTDPFKDAGFPFSDSDLDHPRLLVKVSEAVDLSLSYLRHFSQQLALTSQQPGKAGDVEHAKAPPAAAVTVAAEDSAENAATAGAVLRPQVVLIDPSQSVGKNHLNLRQGSDPLKDKGSSKRHSRGGEHSNKLPAIQALASSSSRRAEPLREMQTNAQVGGSGSTSQSLQKFPVRAGKDIDTVKSMGAIVLMTGSSTLEHAPRNSNDFVSRKHVEPRQKAVAVLHLKPDTIFK